MTIILIKTKLFFPLNSESSTVFLSFALKCHCQTNRKTELPLCYVAKPNQLKTIGNTTTKGKKKNRTPLIITLKY